MAKRADVLQLFHPAVAEWFQASFAAPTPPQTEGWPAIARGESTLILAPTGSGKTLAVWLGALGALRQQVVEGAKGKPPPLAVLWITPMRALAADTLRSLEAPLQALAPGWSTGLRSGDTTSAQRAAQDRRLPTVLVTTPESLTLMLTREHAREEMSKVRLVVVDEWHDLLGNKRGTQTQLAIARLEHWRADLQVWGLSATLGNLELARDALLAPANTPKVTLRGAQPKTLIVDTLIPGTIERFPWSGHLGVR